MKYTHDIIIIGGGSAGLVGARFAAERAMQAESRLRVTLPSVAEDRIVDEALKDS